VAPAAPSHGAPMTGGHDASQGASLGASYGR
jgi:hypothetical protein